MLHDCRHPDDPTKYLPIPDRREVAIRGVTGKDVYIIVHGYNSTPAGFRKTIRFVQQTIEGMSKSAHVAGFSWPSKGTPGPLGYWKDAKMSTVASESLVNVVNSYVYNQKTPPRSVTVLAHSMGGMLCFRYLENVNVFFLGADVPIRYTKPRKYIKPAFQDLNPHINLFSRRDKVIGFIARLIRPGKRIGNNPVEWMTLNYAQEHEIRSAADHHKYLESRNILQLIVDILDLTGITLTKSP